MDARSFCSNCGADLPAGARFCPRCGIEAVAQAIPVLPVEEADLDRQVPPAAIEHSGPVPEGPRSRTWMLVPIVIAVVAGLTLALLSMMPFGGRREAKSRVSAPEAQLPPRDDGRIVEIDPDDPGVRQYPTDSIAPPPAAIPPAETAPVPQDTADHVEVSETDAATSLLDYLESNDVYGIDSTCLGVRNLGFENAGYTFEAMDQCEASRPLGKWRVDAESGDIFRQRPDGRYLAP